MIEPPVKSNIIDARKEPAWNTTNATIEAHIRHQERVIARKVATMMQAAKPDPVAMYIAISPDVGMYLGALEARDHAPST